jgi:hypothetical protein
MRFITWQDRDWSLSDLARRYRLPTGTLSKRLGRFGETATGIHRALTTGIMTHSQAGRIGAKRSSWRHPGP